MPKFRYTVINAENKQLTGTIGAPSEQDARNELNQLGFSILEMKEVAEEETPSTDEKPLPKFEFGAFDKNQKHVMGTIQAEDQFSAYKRLIKEYVFQVEYIVDSKLSEADKAAEKQKGVFELQNRLDEEEIANQKKETKDEIYLKELGEKQRILQSQIEFVLSKVKEFLDQFENDLKRETKEKIRQYVDKVLRIKSSTNLDYVRQSCEELLTFLQKEEIFMHEDAHTKERTKLALDAKSMMMGLHQKNTSNKNDIFKELREWRDVHITHNDLPSIPERFLDFWISFLIGFGRENEETKLIRGQIVTLDTQLKQYFKLYLQAPNNDFKIEAKESLKKLLQDRGHLKEKLKLAQRMIQKEIRSRAELGPFEKFEQEVLSLSGWLLTFYLIYYFASLYLGSKNFGVFNLPANFSIYRSSFLKYFLATLFIFHASLSIKWNFFRRNEVASLIIVPIFLIGTLLVLLNF